MHNINTFNYPDVSNLMNSHKISFQERYREATSFSWKAFSVFLNSSKCCQDRYGQSHDLLPGLSRVFSSKRIIVSVGCINTAAQLCKKPPKSFLNSIESRLLPLQNHIQSACYKYLDRRLLYRGHKAFTKLKCPYSGDDPPCPVEASKYKAVFGFGYSVFLLKPQPPSAIYFLRLCNLFLNRLSRRLINIAEGIFAHRTFNLSPPLSLSSALFIDPPDSCSFPRNNRSIPCLEPNIMSQDNNALYYTNIDLGKCMFSGSCKRPQNFIEQKQSSYGSNTKRKKSRFIPKIFNQEHLFESLSLRNNSPNKLPQTKWFQGFKLYHRKTGRESIMQRSFDSSNSVCLQPVGNAIHSSYRCRTITAVALK